MPDRNKYVTVAIFLVVIAGAIAGWGYSHYSPTVQRWCTNSCLAVRGCDLDFSNGVPRPVAPYCFIHENQCRSWCGSVEDSAVGIVRRPPVKTDIAPGPHGAIAYDKKTGAWGMSDAAVDLKTAKKSALGFCARYGKDCVISDSFVNTCVAVAIGANNAIAWASDVNIEKAKTQAVSKCTKKESSGCTVRHTNCYPHDRH